MKNFPEGIHFKYPWRKYQQQFLDGLDAYFADRHLHVVAPPGSGKTVLGLEMMLRLDEPTLIVAPTLAIRDQWIVRFYELFLQTEEKVDWISSDFKNPKKVTVTTYQGIHAACNNLIEAESDEETSDDDTIISTNKSIKDVIARLKKQKVKTFILDEAHHLKNAWWSSLMVLKDEIQPNVVALTATPPFEVSGLEWQRYIQLNGEVDAEISVPELMVEGDLCPHQDYVYLTLPTEKEQVKVEHYYERANRFIEEIKADDTLLEAIESHPVYQNPKAFLDWIYDNISCYSSGLVFLQFRGREISEVHFEVLGDKQKFVPRLDVFWIEELLDFYLFVDPEHFQKFEEHRLNLENRLKRNGFAEKKFISFYNSKNLNQIFNESIGKLQGIQEICEFEFSSMQHELRMLILTDFIRKEYIATSSENNLNIEKIGSIPIFETLRRQNSSGKKLGVLTGSIVILPKSAEVALQQICTRKNIFEISGKPLSYDENYLLIPQTEQTKHQLVQVMTELFEKGEVEVLVGTKSLLGEGWDAPKINSLILASFISSFVLSNQMRGRAIRVDKDNPEKTGNIWHVACFDPQSEVGGSDYQMIQKRFKTFVGVSNTETPTIENSYNRLGFGTIENVEQIQNFNQQTFKLAANRKNLINLWKQALNKGEVLIEEMQIPFLEEGDIKDKQKSFLGKSIGYFSLSVISALLAFMGNSLSETLKFWLKMGSGHSLFIFSTIVGIAGLFAFGGRFYRAFQQYLKYKNISRHIEKYGEVILNGLLTEGVIKTPMNKLKIISKNDENGNTICYLSGGNRFESGRFMDLLQELLLPIDNPRYLIKEKKNAFLGTSERYFSVPELFARNKKSAERFLELWNGEFSKSELVYTRSVEGRRIILQERFKTLMKRNIHIEHINVWTR